MLPLSASTKARRSGPLPGQERDCLLGRGTLCSSTVSLGQQSFGGDADLDLIADVRDVLTHAEIAALDGGRGVETGGLHLVHRVLAGTVDGDVQYHRPGLALDGQITSDGELVEIGRAHV